MSDQINNLTGLTPERRALLALKARRLKERGEKSAADEPPILPQPRKEGVNLFPPSPAQERLWFLDQLVPESSAFNLAIPMRLRGELQISTLKHSLNAMLERHEVLRTNLLTKDGQPVQVVAPAVEVRWKEQDLRHLPAPERERQAEEVAAAEVVRPFNLAEEPLLRAMLLRLDEDEHVVLLTMHHVVFDEWSAGIFVHEMATLYEAFTHGKPSPLPPLPVQYADYAVWQRQWLQGAGLQKQLDYWRKQLAGPLPILELPTDRPRPAVQTSRGAKYSVACPKKLSDALLAFSRQEGVTLFITLLAAFKTLLYRYTGQTDVMVGSPIANRNRREIERLIGFFVNALVLRTDLSGARSFREALGRVRETVLQAFTHQDVPFKKLIQELQPERDPSRRQPLFHITFSVQNAMPKESRQLPQLVLTPFLLQSEVETFEDLNFLVTEGEDEIVLSAEYNTDLFDEATISRLTGHYLTLLESIVADPDQDLGGLAILPAAERHRLLYEWNDTHVYEANRACIHEMFEQQVRLMPEATAVVFGAEHLTYRELNSRANQLARHLRKHGAGAESIVGICVDRSLEMVVGVLGALKAGSAYLMLDPAYPPERLAFMLEDSNVPVLLTKQMLREHLPSQRGRIIYLDTDWETISRESTENLGRIACADNLAFVIYTSGSTGRPKGIGLPHLALGNLISWHLKSVACGARTIQFASLSFDVSLQEIFSTCCSGGTLFLIPESLRTDLARLARFIAEQRIEMLHLPVVALQQLAEGFCEQPELFVSLRGICVAGEQLTITRSIARLFEQLEDCALNNHYGPSETHVVTAYTARHPPSGWPVLPPIGTPIFNTQIHVLDSNLRPVPVGVPGEVYIGGDCLARNYLNRPDGTAEKFIPNPFSAKPGRRLYQTGDLAHYLPDGNIQFLGRADHQVKVRGFRIELGEIETTLGRHPAVRDAVVVAREDVPGEKRLAAYVVLHQQHTLASPVSELRRFTREKLPDYMMPSAFVILEALPQLPNGKVDRRSLPAPESARPDLDIFYVTPRTPMEQALSDIWAEVLRLDRVGVNDNFFELGGDSIRSFQVISRANRSGLKLTLKQFYDHPTIAGMASFVEEADEVAVEWSPPSSAPRSRPQAEALRSDAAVEDVYPLSPLQVGMLFHCIYARRPGEYLEKVSFAQPGKLDVELFERAWQTVVRRHAALRTAFIWEDVDEPLQVVYRSVDLPIERHDWRGRSETEQAEMLRAFIDDEQNRDFDLRHAPMMRLTLLRMDDEAYQFVWSYKHLILDGWSQVLVLREVGEIYESLARGSGGLSEADHRYRDYIDWLQRQDLSQAGTYWRRALSDLDGPTVISLDSRLQAAPDGELYAERWMELSEDVTQGLRSFARRHQLTLNTLVQGVWALLLSRYSNEREVVFGSVVNGRSAEMSGSEEMVGMFINTLPVKVSVPEEQTVVDWLKQLQAEQAEARQYEYSPLVEVQKWSPVPPGTPLFESVVVFKNYPDSAASPWQFTDWSVQQTGYPLHLYVEPGDKLALQLTYMVTRFDDATVGRMLELFQALAANVLARGGEPVGVLPRLTDAERLQLLATAGETVADFPLDTCFIQHFEAQVERTPDAVAVVFADRQLTYDELNRRANRLAHSLVEEGVGVETVVALFAERGITFLTAMLAIFKAGGAYLPLDPRHPARSLAGVLEQSGVSLVLQSETLAPSLLPALNNLPHGKRPRALTIEKVLQGDVREGNPPPRSSPAALAYVIYTSGSTGKPKGVMVEQRGMLNHLYAKVLDLELAGDDAVAQTASQSFDISVWQFLSALLVGGRTHIIGDEAARDPSPLLEQIRTSGISLFEAVPSMLHMMLDATANARSHDKQLGRLRWMIPTGEALPPELCRQWFDSYPQIPLLNAYGPTECSDDVSHYPVRQSPPKRWVNMPIGRAVANMRLYVLDRLMQPAPFGVAGELYVGGVGVGRGYVHDPQRTAEAFVPDPFAAVEAGGRLYRTGDRARHLADGNVEFLGRIDHQVKVRGFRIELGGIETVLNAHADLRESVVSVREDRPGNKRLVAYVVPLEGRSASPDVLRHYLKEQLPDYMMPSAFVPLETLPRTPNGKIDRRKLPAPPQSNFESGERAEPPRSAVEQQLVKIWSEVLGRESVGIHDNFFELGGDSILGIQVIARANRAKLGLTPMHLFQHQTIAGLAEVAGAAPAAQAAEEPEVISAPLTPIQNWFFEQEMAEPHHWNQSVLFNVREAIEPTLMKRAVGELFRYHDALRSRFVKGAQGWEQSDAGKDVETPFIYEDLSRLSSSSQTASIEETAARLQASLNLAQGSLVRVALFNLGDECDGRLLLVIHHLVVDGVSWRILLEDLQTIYQQLSRGEAVELPPKATSYRQWAARLAEYARGEELHSESDYWMAAGLAESGGLPVDYPEGVNSVASERVVTSELSREETRQLLQETPEAYRTEINDLLLSALLLTTGKWTGSNSLLVNMEGHGREDIAPGINVSRTVGWFTSLFPVAFKTEDSPETGELIKSVKEQLRSVPRKGIGYGLLRYLSSKTEVAERLRALPQPEISFNYLGRFDQALEDSPLFAPAPESAGANQNQNNSRGSLIEITALVSDGRLRVGWSFSENLHRRAVIEKLAEDFIESLRGIVAHCLSAENGAFTPSDFPHADLNQAGLDSLVGTLEDGRAAGAAATTKGRRHNIQDIYRLSPLQQGILFQLRYAPSSGAYALQLAWRVEGKLDVDAFTGALQRVLMRHTVMRTSFHWEQLDESVQVVHRWVEPPVAREDWLGCPEEEQRARLAAYMDEDRARGFDLTRAPLMRVALLRMGEHLHEIVWSWHHLILDGWSFALLLHDINEEYLAMTEQREAQLGHTRPFRDYIAWLERQDLTQAEAYWRRVLGNLTAPTLLSPARNHLPVSEVTYARRRKELSRDTTGMMQQLAQQHQLTMNTLAQGAWGLLLSLYSGESAAVFGGIVSGRSVELEGIEEMVGLFVNTLPVRVVVVKEQTVVDWLKQLQAEQAEARQYEYSPLVEVQKWSPVPPGTPLFESVFAFTNVTMGKSAAPQGDSGLAVRDARIDHRTTYPLHISAEPGERFAFDLDYMTDSFDESMIERILQHLERLIESMVRDPFQQVSKLTLLTADEQRQMIDDWDEMENE